MAAQPRGPQYASRREAGVKAVGNNICVRSKEGQGFSTSGTAKPEKQPTALQKTSYLPGEPLIVALQRLIASLLVFLRAATRIFKRLRRLAAPAAQHCYATAAPPCLAAWVASGGFAHVQTYFPRRPKK